MNKQQAIDRLVALKKELRQLQSEELALLEIIDSPETPTIPKEQRFWELVNGLTWKIDREKYPHRVFGFMDGECWVDYNSESKTLLISYDNIWWVFQQEYSLEHEEIQGFIKNQVEKYFNCRGITPWDELEAGVAEVEKYFNCRGITPA